VRRDGGREGKGWVVGKMATPTVARAEQLSRGARWAGRRDERRRRAGKEDKRAQNLCLYEPKFPRSSHSRALHTSSVLNYSLRSEL
jgi:hypothetical protein